MGCRTPKNLISGVRCSSVATGVVRSWYQSTLAVRLNVSHRWLRKTFVSANWRARSPSKSPYSRYTRSSVVALASSLNASRGVICQSCFAEPNPRTRGMSSRSRSCESRQDLREEEAAGAAAGALGHDVAVVALDPHAPPGIGVEGHGQILAVADRPEEGNLEERALGARVADLGIQEAGLPLAPEGRAEEGHERDQRDVPHPERGAGARRGPR